MAQLVIEIPDAAVPRIRSAFGYRDATTQVWVDATVADVTAKVKAFIKGRVIDHEVDQQAISVRNQKSKENWNG